MVVTVVLHGGVNPAMEYGFEGAVDGSVALNPCGLKFFEVPSAQPSLECLLRIGLKTHEWAVEQGVDPLLSILFMEGFYFRFLPFFRSCFRLLSA